MSSDALPDDGDSIDSGALPDDACDSGEYTCLPCNGPPPLNTAMDAFIDVEIDDGAKPTEEDGRLWKVCCPRDCLANVRHSA